MKAMSGVINNRVNLRGVISSLLVLGVLLIQGCVEIENITSVKQKVSFGEKGDEGVRIPDPYFGKAPTPVEEIPDGDLCQFDPSAPDCPSISSDMFIPDSCPARDILDSAPPVVQNNGVVCWAATAESIITAHRVPKKQCQIIQEVYDLSEDCCLQENQNNPRCLENGWPHKAFKNPRTAVSFDFEYSRAPLPLKKLAHLLCEYGPVSFIVVGHDDTGHSFVINDLDFEDEKWWVLTLDHTSPGKFSKISYEAYWEGLWGTYNPTNSEHHSDLFKVQKLP